MRRIYVLLFAFILTGFYAVNSLANMTNVANKQITTDASVSEQPLFVNLTSNQPNQVNDALHMAFDALNNGHPVIVYLSGNSATVALKSTLNQTQNAFAAPAKMLQQIITKGGEVWVCPISLKNAGYTSNDLIKGTKLYNYALLEQHFFNSNVKTLSY